MDGLYNWAWVEARVAETSEAWNQCASDRLPEAPSFSVGEQRKREKAYDEGRNAVERELKRARGHRTAAGRLETQRRVTAMFARFSAAALDLNDDAIDLLTHDFLPAGTRLGRWARQFDPELSMPDIIQACRNAWTACGLQPLMGERVELTPSILGYSLLYPIPTTISTAPRSPSTRSSSSAGASEDGCREKRLWRRTSAKQRCGRWWS
jgi:hypothetical protein